MSNTKNTQRPFSFFGISMLLLLSGYWFVACSTIIEMDPTWRIDGSTPGDAKDERKQDKEPTESRPRDKYKESEPEKRPESPSGCPIATPLELTIQQALSKDSPVLLHGTLANAPNTTLYIALPSKWKATPGTTRTDAQGRYGFLIDRSKEKKDDQIRLQVYADNGTCVAVEAIITDDKPSAKKLEVPGKQSCKKGTTLDVVVYTKGLLTEPLTAISTAPPYAVVMNVAQRQEKDSTYYTLRIQCLAKGKLLILLGSPKLLSTSLDLDVR